jgi:hypothetical protein
MTQWYKLGLNLLVFLFFISFVGSQEMCVDLYVPYAPEHFYISNSGNNIDLRWSAAKDIPLCGDIDYYNIYRDGRLIGNTYMLSFIDKNVSFGSHAYSIRAVDKAGHEGIAIDRMFSVSIPATNNIKNASNSSNIRNASNGSGGGVIHLTNNKAENSSYIFITNKTGANESECETMPGNSSIMCPPAISITGDFIAVFKEMDYIRWALLILVILLMIAIIYLRIRMILREGWG